MQIRPVVCEHCGCVQSNSEIRALDGVDDRSLQFVIGIALVVVAAYAQLLSWGNSAFEIIPIKITHSLGAASPAQYERLVSICKELYKYECVEDSLTQLSRTDRSYLAKLGQFQMARQKFDAAAHSFQSYFAAGGNDLEITYAYAKALGEMGRIAEASQQFERVLRSKPDVLQRTVISNYVNFLVKHQQLAKAAGVIERFRKKSETISSFLENELRLIKNRLARS
jgi:tetratricopeptide (TPR) repeat protein